MLSWFPFPPVSVSYSTLIKKMTKYAPLAPILFRCPFLAWMSDDGQAITKLCLRTTSEFLEENDIFISYGEVNQTVFIYVFSNSELERILF